MISMQNVALAASFMTVGMMETGHGRGIDDIYKAWNKGGLELHVELCQYAEMSEKLVNLINKHYKLDFPGVYDYEVSEPFGKWFGEYIFEHHKAPTLKEATEHLVFTIVSFFSQGASLYDEQRTELYTALMQEVT